MGAGMICGVPPPLPSYEDLVVLVPLQASGSVSCAHRRGQHRSAGAVDLLVAATAELNTLTLVHYDRDFDQIAKATGQPAVWLAPAGSIN